MMLALRSTLVARLSNSDRPELFETYSISRILEQMKLKFDSCGTLRIWLPDCHLIRNICIVAYMLLLVENGPHRPYTVTLSIVGIVNQSKAETKLLTNQKRGRATYNLPLITRPRHGKCSIMDHRPFIAFGDRSVQPGPYPTVSWASLSSPFSFFMCCF
jgi:hypothetical protein